MSKTIHTVKLVNQKKTIDENKYIIVGEDRWLRETESDRRNKKISDDYDNKVYDIGKLKDTIEDYQVDRKDFTAEINKLNRQLDKCKNSEAVKELFGIQKYVEELEFKLENKDYESEEIKKLQKMCLDQKDSNTRMYHDLLAVQSKYDDLKNTTPMIITGNNVDQPQPTNDDNAKLVDDNAKLTRRVEIYKNSIKRQSDEYESCLVDKGELNKEHKQLQEKYNKMKFSYKTYKLKTEKQIDIVDTVIKDVIQTNTIETQTEVVIKEGIETNTIETQTHREQKSFDAKQFSTEELFTKVMFSIFGNKNKKIKGDDIHNVQANRIQGHISQMKKKIFTTTEKKDNKIDYSVEYIKRLIFLENKLNV